MTVKVTFRYPSKAFAYGYAEQQMELPDKMSPADVAKMYVASVLEYQAAEIEANKVSHTDAQKAAEDLMASELGAKKISESVNKSAAQDGADELSHSEKAAISSEPPWKKPAEATAVKPWENTPHVDLFG